MLIFQQTLQQLAEALQFVKDKLLPIQIIQQTQTQLHNTIGHLPIPLLVLQIQLDRIAFYIQMQEHTQLR